MARFASSEPSSRILLFAGEPHSPIGGRWWTGFALFFLLGVAGLTAQSLTVDYVEGSASVQQGGSWIPLTIGQSVPRTSSVKVASGAVLVLKDRGTQITLASRGSYSLREVLSMTGARASPQISSTVGASLVALLERTASRQSTVMGIRGVGESQLAGHAREDVRHAESSMKNHAFRRAALLFSHAIESVAESERPYLRYLRCFALYDAGEIGDALGESRLIPSTTSAPWWPDFVVLKARIDLSRYAASREVRWLQDNRQVGVGRGPLPAIYWMMLGIGYRGLGSVGAAVQCFRLAGSADRGGMIGTAAKSLLPGGAAGRPSWLHRYPHDSEFLYGVGGAADRGNGQRSLYAARREAVDAIVAEVENDLDRHSHVALREVSDLSSGGTITLLIDNQLDLPISGLSLADSYHSRAAGYWVLYRLPRAALEPNPEIARAVESLLSDLPSPSTVALGSITDSGTGVGGSLSLYLADQLFLGISGRRNISFPNSAVISVPGHIQQSMHELTGSYVQRQHGKKIAVRLRLDDPMRERAGASASFMLHRNLLPRWVGIAPGNLSIALAARRSVREFARFSAGGPFVGIWTDRGRAADFFSGESVFTDVQATSNCYVEVYHIDADGDLALVYPNRYTGDGNLKAGAVHQIPGPGSPYEFVLGRPLGAELFVAVASKTPFVMSVQPFVDLGPFSRRLLASVTRRAVASAPMGVAYVSYTIIPRPW